jgi:hypothetical protein
MVPTSTHVPVAQTPAATDASPATEAPTSATATPTPEAPRLQLQTQPQRSEVRRVILISIDAARAMDVWPLARDGFLKNMGKIAAEGAYGELSPIYPAETSPNHAAFLTGAPSGIHGVFANASYPSPPSRAAGLSGATGAVLSRRTPSERRLCAKATEWLFLTLSTATSPPGRRDSATPTRAGS